MTDFLAAHGGVLVHLNGVFALLQVTGDDAEAFLQGQFTCDVEALQKGQSSYGAYCTAKGRMLASFLIWRNDSGFVLMVAADLVETMRRRLQMFILRAKVKIETLGPQGTLIGLAGNQIAGLQHEAGLLLKLDEWRSLLHIDNEQPTDLSGKFSASLKSAEAETWQWLDIVQGIPWITAATQEQFIPQMVNLEKIGGVSFKKGCYPGQEIVARTQYLGKASRRMHLMHSEALLQAGDEIYADTMGDQSCGMVVNAIAAPQGGCDALAVVHQDALNGPVHAQSLTGPRMESRPLPYDLKA